MVKQTTNQDTSKDMNRNPTGKGGFGDNPQNRSNGRWNKDNSFSYWYNFFKHLTVAELKDWVNNNPEEVRTVASDLALRRIQNSQKDLKEFQEVADRSEGKPKQTAEVSLQGGINISLVRFIDDGNQDDRSSDTEALPPAV